MLSRALGQTAPTKSTSSTYSRGAGYPPSTGSPPPEYTRVSTGCMVLVHGALTYRVSVGLTFQPSNGQIFNCQPSKTGNYCRQPSKKKISVLLVVKPFHGLANITISISCSSRTAGSQRIV